MKVQFGKFKSQTQNANRPPLKPSHNLSTQKLKKDSQNRKMEQSNSKVSRPTSSKQYINEAETPRFKAGGGFNANQNPSLQLSPALKIEDYFSFGEQLNNSSTNISNKTRKDIKSKSFHIETNSQKQQQQKPNVERGVLSLKENRQGYPQKHIQIFNNNYNIININQNANYQKKDSLRSLQKQFQQIIETQHLLTSKKPGSSYRTSSANRKSQHSSFTLK